MQEIYVYKHIYLMKHLSIMIIFICMHIVWNSFGLTCCNVWNWPTNCFTLCVTASFFQKLSKNHSQTRYFGLCSYGSYQHKPTQFYRNSVFKSNVRQRQDSLLGNLRIWKACYSNSFSHFYYFLLRKLYSVLALKPTYKVSHCI